MGKLPRAVFCCKMVLCALQLFCRQRQMRFLFRKLLRGRGILLLVREPLFLIQLITPMPILRMLLQRQDATA